MGFAIWGGINDDALRNGGAPLDHRLRGAMDLMTGGRCFWGALHD
jgi:hypothetical protein